MANPWFRLPHVLVATTLIVACAATDDPGFIEPQALTSSSPGATPTPSPTPTPTPSPSSQPTSSPSSTPTPTASPTLAPSPTPTPTPTPSPTPTPTPTAERVVVSPTSATINAMPPSGPGAPGYVTTVKLSATVTMSDGSTNSRVTWSSSDPARVVVAPDGTVHAPSTATAGTATVTATAQGTSIKASALITVTTEGDLFIIVE